MNRGWGAPAPEQRLDTITTCASSSPAPPASWAATSWKRAVRHDTEVVALLPPSPPHTASPDPHPLPGPDWFTALGATPRHHDFNAPDAASPVLTELLAGADFIINAPLPGPHHTTATTALLDAALPLDDTIRGVVQLSSTRTYGFGLPPWPMDESWVARPVSPRLHDLASAERAARTYRRLPLVVLRAAPTFGPRDHGPTQRLIDYYGLARRPRLAAAGRVGVSLAYGPDFARAVWAVLAAFDDAGGRILHAKTIDTDWRTLVGQSRALRERSGRVWPLPAWIAHGLAHAGAPGRRLLNAPTGLPDYTQITGCPHLIDDTLLRGLTGFTPLFGLRAALRHTLALESRDSP